MEKIGFIGTGIMGNAMAGHLLTAGYKLSVYNRTKTKTDDLLARGAKWCATAGECARNQDIIITMVGYPKDVEEIYLGTDGILENAQKGAYIIDMTTSSPVLAAKIYDEAKKKGIFALDAPVTGGDIGAKNATLSILAGGDEAAFKRIEPILHEMGKNIIYEGSIGAGQKTKACNQIAIAGALVGACEAFSYAKSAGLDIKKVFSSISKGAASSFQMNNVVVNALKGDFRPGFMLKHFIKDMNIGVDTSTQFGIELPVLQQVLKEAKEVADKGMNDSGTQSLLKYYEK